VTLEEVCASRVGLWGIGVEGIAMAELLTERGAVPILIDDLPERASARFEAATGNTRSVVRPDEEVLRDLDVVVRAPGVSRYRPELAAAERAGVTVTTPMAIWLEDFVAAPVLAITGTKGKSTTAALAAAILRETGREVALIGNIGVPVTDMYRRAPADAYVVEVSSYQAVDVTVTPGVCVLTSLAPDHLDWHGGTEAYYRDKLRLIDAGPPGALAVNAASDEAVRRTAHRGDRILFGPSGRVHATDSGLLVVDGAPLGELPVLQVPGMHNLWNLCGAITGVLLLDGACPSIDAIRAGAEGFAGLPSRCHRIGERDGITFVDDALASNPFATVASLDAFPDRELTVILGGADRGVDPSDLAEAIATRRPVPRVVVLPPVPDRLLGALVGTANVAADIEEAVRIATSVTPAGGVVIFSPAAPTPDGEGGYAERSRQFVEASGF
jgi:UDP-N-acetylmuramoylalanine--D-glutamate ligase